MFTALVTGSRTAPTAWKADLFTALSAVLSWHGPLFAVRHGDCPAGPDRWATQWHQRHAHLVVLETRPVRNWVDCDPTRCAPGHRRNRGGRWYCPAEGHYRNESMVDEGVDVVLALRHNQSPGTGHCIRYARSCGVPVVEHPFTKLADVLAQIVGVARYTPDGGGPR